MKTVCRFLLAAALLWGPLCFSAQAQESGVMPDLWPFNNASELADSAPPAAREDSIFRPISWPDVEMPNMWPSVRIRPPVLDPSVILRPIQRFNAATRRFFTNAQAWRPFGGTSDPAPRLYDDPVTVGDFMDQPRLDP